MIISRQAENISDNMPTTASRIEFENRGDMVRAWNRIRRSGIKSNIHSPFINWSIGFPLLSGGVKGERGVLFLVNQHERICCPTTKLKGLGNNCLFLHVNLTQLQLLYWLKFSQHVPTTPIVLNGWFLLS